MLWHVECSFLLPSRKKYAQHSWNNELKSGRSSKKTLQKKQLTGKRCSGRVKYTFNSPAAKLPLKRWRFFAPYSKRVEAVENVSKKLSGLILFFQTSTMRRWRARHKFSVKYHTIWWVSQKWQKKSNSVSVVPHKDCWTCRVQFCQPCRKFIAKSPKKSNSMYGKAEKFFFREKLFPVEILLQTRELQLKHQPCQIFFGHNAKKNYALNSEMDKKYCRFFN